MEKIIEKQVNRQVTRKKERGLTLKQERFCRNYTQNSHLFGNGTLSYAEAYGYDIENASRVRERDEKGNEIPNSSEREKIENVCAVNGNRLLCLSKIDDYIRGLLNAMLTDEVVDAQLMKVLLRGKDADQIAAIREYNKLKQRIINRSEISGVNGGPLMIGAVLDKLEEIEKPSIIDVLDVVSEEIPA